MFLFQCLLLIVDLICFSRIASLFHAKLSTTALPFFSTFFFLFEHGNLTEEFSMPLVLAGIYYELKYLASDDEKHSPRIAYFYGILLGLLAFIRVNNAITLCSLLLCIAASLIRRNQWINLLQNLLLGLLGLATVSVPVCWYFYTHGALYDMLYGTFLHNMLYATNHTHYPIFSALFLKFLALYAPGICACAIFFIKWKSKRCRLYTSLLFAALMSYGMLIYTNVYTHYFLLGPPLFAIAVAAEVSGKSFPNVWKGIIFHSFHREHMNPLRGNSVSILLAGITSLYILLSVYSACAPIYKTYLTDISYNEYAQIVAGMSVIPEDERDSVIAYQTRASLYCHADIVPCYKYFTLQKWMTTSKVNIYLEFMKNIVLEHPLWIVIRTGEKDYTIRALLTGFYTCKWSDSTYSYFRYTGPSQDHPEKC